ncbi:hypothetical protein [Burkholderia gladioli]|uniref:hypothetical protein n=1 Tax=Burkholderia gladioli TaxID=28095 RepID=UPI000FD74267|nr:hypothetical protein [Burkholderia gladioli]
MDPAPLPISDHCRSACADYLKYLRTILSPALKELKQDSDNRSLVLHRVIGGNLCAAHAADYIFAIRKTVGLNEKRGKLIEIFDKEFGISGARIQGGKMALVDAVNNAMKHIRIDPTRYKILVQKYGQVSFKCLVEDGGRILCLLDGFRFDYVRVVLMPVLQALCRWTSEDEEGIAELSLGGTEKIELSETDKLDYDDSIDALIDACNPRCSNCDEHEEECQCAEYIFDGQIGHFETRFSTDIEIDSLLFAVSGAYRRDRLI